MNRWFKFTITRQFLLFFLLTSIVPFIVISLLVLQAIDNKFSERISRMLVIGALSVEEIYKDGLGKLAVSTNQATLFSLSREFQQYLESASSPQNRAVINRYIAMRNLNIVELYDRTGKKRFSSCTLENLSGKSHQAILNRAFQGKSVASVEHYRTSGGNILLEYISASPVFVNNDETRPVKGVLLTGQSLPAGLSMREMKNILPELHLRLYVQEDASGGNKQLYTSIEGSPEKISPAFVSRLEEFIPRRLLARDSKISVFRERIDGVFYKSKALVLRNFIREPVGFFIISTSEGDLRDLKWQNVSYLTLYLLFGLMVVSLMGMWFKRMFVDPMRELAAASEKVSEGKLDFQIQHPDGGREISKTFASFNKMLAQLQEDERLRSTFISTLTHDLRTPLIAQKRVLEMYEEYGADFPSELESLNKGLLKNNDHLLEMVNKLLEAYQYEAGKIVLMNSYFSLHSLLNECFEEFRPLAQPRNITLINEVPSPLPPVYADKGQLWRVLGNLIGNALMNIQEGRHIVVRAECRDGVFRIKVEDNGPGIRPDILPHLFTRYFTGDRLRQKIGSGLGLYICRMIIEQHGGKIWAESELGNGTRIVFEIPEVPQDAATEET